MKATVSIVDKSPQRLKELHSKFGDAIIPFQSDKIDLNELIKNCDLLIGSVLVPGANAPKLSIQRNDWFYETWISYC